MRSPSRSFVLERICGPDNPLRDVELQFSILLRLYKGPPMVSVHFGKTRRMNISVASPFLQLWLIPCIFWPPRCRASFSSDSEVPEKKIDPQDFA